ncbi:molybdopterin molybdotransferase MoeA [uncultured Tenacibaculum sp.]|uniref:molybdopterin molybdotransferase MoeA n=1 Tax=uncultured Tenacibaculum sp. TaxID=174713 RepID=UPI00261D07EE|nr:molybdopterin molybdotransferase MoeA [uncultured Tenacibaculum sp.]
MISVEEAIETIKKNSISNEINIEKKLEKADGYLLAEDIYAPINLPPFRQSAMDGYGIHIHKEKEYTIIGEIKAGDKHNYQLKKGEAIKILTGAPVPEDVDTVIMQENTMVTNTTVEIKETVVLNKNIRPIGEQIKVGEIALKKHTKINPAVVGFLYSLGIDTVKVIKKPSIGIISTGNELIALGLPLSYGEIYESNSKMLLSALYNLKIYDVTIYKIKDNYEDTVSTIANAIKEHDIVLISGGISVGKYDFVYRALQDLEVNELFYKVNQKPGKPLFYGKKNETQIFGLPGNPAAALICFYSYVYISLQSFFGKSETELKRIQAKALDSYTEKRERSVFLKAFYENGNVRVLESQNSSMLQSFATSNALIYLPSNRNEIKINDTVTVILLPF